MEFCSSSRKSRKLEIEALDARITLDGAANAAAGLPWFDPGSLSYSFAPDGTRLGDEQSRLFEELSATGTPAEWQGEFARALDAWLSTLNANAAQVDDSGHQFGTFGKTQGDPRFGDIRIGAIPLSRNTMAESVPHSVIAQGTWSGDILLNSNADWENLQQVYAVALHEFGHVLGVGHSDDPNSPMFFHGVHDALQPTHDDLTALQELYHGVDVGSDDDHSSGGEHSESNEFREEPHFSFDPSSAFSLQAQLGATARYTATGELTESAPNTLYRLEPIGEIDHFEHLNIVVSAQEWDGLIPAVKLFDHSGDPVPFRTLHHAAGVLVVQADDVEPNQSFYLAVTPIATAARHQVGAFEVFAEYSVPRLQATVVAEYEVTTERPIVEQNFKVRSTKLVHLLVESEPVGQSSQGNRGSGQSAIWGSLVDGEGEIVAQFAMPVGSSRSAPLMFLSEGEYKLILQSGTSDDSPPSPALLKVSIDELSIDVGPGVVDPSNEPLVNCGEIGADPNQCHEPTPTIPVAGPVYPDPANVPPAPTYPSIPPWSSPPWYFWPQPALQGYRQNPVSALDVSGDQHVTAIDALLVIDELNRGAHPADYFFDTSGDDFLSPIDVLLVVNHLNSASSGEGEGGQWTKPSKGPEHEAAGPDESIASAWSQYRQLEWFDWQLVEEWRGQLRSRLFSTAS